MTFTHARERYICAFDFSVMLRVIDALNLNLKVGLFQKYLVCDYLSDIHIILHSHFYSCRIQNDICSHYKQICL